jgi:hypothetical protein
MGRNKAMPLKTGGIVMNDKALGLTNTELELTQRIQMFFPRGIIPMEVLKEWNGCKKEIITKKILEFFSQRLEMPLLEFLGTVMAPATEKFVAREKFVVEGGLEATAPRAWTKNYFYYSGEKFLKWFFDKIEEPQPKIQLRYAELTKRSPDGSIIKELGGEHKVKTTLAKIHALIERQPYGEDGELVTNTHSNIFYANDVNDELRAVRVTRFSCWVLSADYVEDPCYHFIGDRVFSPNFKTR